MARGKKSRLVIKSRATGHLKSRAKGRSKLKPTYKTLGGKRGRKR